jgi:hypothetical protein
MLYTIIAEMPVALQNYQIKDSCLLQVVDFQNIEMGL